VGEVAEFIHQAVPLLVVDLKDLFDSSDNVHDFGAFHISSWWQGRRDGRLGSRQGQARRWQASQAAGCVSLSDTQSRRGLGGSWD